MRTTRTATSAPDALRLSLFLVHAAVIGYVVSGWLSPTRTGLLVYLVLLPLILLQWLVNRGASVVSNLESLIRTHHWRAPEHGIEANVFRSILSSIGIRASNAQVNTVLVSTMLLLWMSALARLMLIVPESA